MRIAIFSDNFYPELSGITDSIMATGAELAGRGHSVVYCVPRYSDGNYRLLARSKTLDMGPNVSVARLPAIPVRTGTGQGRLVIPCGASIRRLRRFKPDVLHFNLIFGTGLEAILASKVLKKPLVGTCHTPIVEFLQYSPIQGAWLKALAMRYDGWFHNHARFLSSPTHFIFDEMKYFDKRIPHAAVPNPIDTEHFRPTDDHGPGKRRPFTVLYAGRLAPEKKIDLVMRAVASAKEKVPDIRFIILGRGAYENELRALARELHIESDVEFRGFVPTEKLPSSYHESDLFAIMSTAETQSIVAMQALACGIPVIAADAWGFKGYITEDVGFRIPPGDVDLLTEKIVLLARDPALRKKLGIQGRAHVEKFSVRSIAEKWEAIYGQAVKDYNKEKTQ